MYMFSKKKDDFFFLLHVFSSETRQIEMHLCRNEGCLTPPAGHYQTSQQQVFFISSGLFIRIKKKKHWGE